jgi:hypothetical protein
VNLSYKSEGELDVVAHTYNLSTWEAEAGEPEVQVHPAQQSESLSQKVSEK